MRDKPRYSIIPAGAVTDPRLEGRDLQVLCLLGCHSDKLGWCEASSQSDLAELIGCSRQTFQRSIVRLVFAGWVQTKTAFLSESGRPYAPYAYRVIMDRDEPDIPPNKHEVAATIPDEGAHGRAGVPTGGQGVPTMDGQGCPRMHGHKKMTKQRDQESESESRAREPLISGEATKLAWEIAAIAGVIPSPSDLRDLPPGWHGAPMRIDAFLREGYHPEILLLAALEVMASRKAKEPPWSVEFFAKAFAKVRARQSAALPTIDDQQNSNGSAAHAKPSGIVAAGERRIAQLQQRIRERECREGTESPVRVSAGNPDVQVLPPRRRG